MVSRETVALRQQAYVTSGNSRASVPDAIKTVEANITGIPIPLGWNRKDPFAPNVLQKIVGLLITIVAASFGAPFWFGVLTRLTNIRSSGPKPS